MKEVMLLLIILFTLSFVANDSDLEKMKVSQNSLIESSCVSCEKTDIDVSDEKEGDQLNELYTGFSSVSMENYSIVSVIEDEPSMKSETYGTTAQQKYTTEILSLVYNKTSLETNITHAPSNMTELIKINQDIPWPVKKEAVVEGDLVIGGLMMVHEREDTITCGPIMPQGGIQALEAMLYTLDRVNSEETVLLPNITIGAHILDDCDKDTYGLEIAVDFIKGK